MGSSTIAHRPSPCCAVLVSVAGNGDFGQTSTRSTNVLQQRRAHPYDETSVDGCCFGCAGGAPEVARPAARAVWGGYAPLGPCWPRWSERQPKAPVALHLRAKRLSQGLLYFKSFASLHLECNAKHVGSETCQTSHLRVYINLEVPVFSDLIQSTSSASMESLSREYVSRPLCLASVSFSSSSSPSSPSSSTH